jgi:hypothetical protein
MCCRSRENWMWSNLDELASGCAGLRGFTFRCISMLTLGCLCVLSVFKEERTYRLCCHMVDQISCGSLSVPMGELK